MSRLKNMCRFTRELDEKLIEIVKKNEVLYDIGHNSYKDLNVRDDVWLAISSVVGKTVQDCKTRWRSLRDLYHRKKKDQKMGKKVRTPWEYMDALSFLEEFTNERRPHIVDDDSDDQEGDTKIYIKQEFDLEEASTSRQNGDEPNNKRIKLEVHEQPFYQTTSSYDSSAILHILGEIRDVVRAKETPIATFFDSMAKTVMQFPPARAAEVKLKVCQIVTEMECKILEETGNYPEDMEPY